MNRTWNLLVVTVCCGLLFVASAQASEKIKVVASFGVLADIARQLGGDKVTIEAIVSAGVDPHAYHLRPQDVKKIEGADIIILNGLGFEPVIERAVRASNFSGILVYAASRIDKIESAGGHMHHDDAHDEHDDAHDEHDDPHDEHDDPHDEHDDAHDEHDDAQDEHDDAQDEHDDAQDDDHIVYDSHGFQDPLSVALYAEEIIESYIKARPSERAVFEANLAAWKEMVSNLDKKVREKFAKYKGKLGNKKLLISHGGMAYFERSYGVSFVSLEGLSGVATLSAKRLMDVTNAGITGILWEYGRNSQGLQLLSRELALPLGGPLYIGVLGTEGSNGKVSNWQEMILYNTDAILTVLDQASTQE